MDFTLEEYFRMFVQCIIKIIQYIVSYFSVQDYYVHSARIEYTVEGSDVREEDDVTYEYRHQDGAKTVMLNKSDRAKDVLFRVTYFFKTRKYILLSRNPEHVFPRPTPPVSFRVPIKEAFLIDAAGAPVENVTNEIKMYEGPDADFHGETIALRDLKLGDEESKKIRFVNILGSAVEHNLESDSITHQTIWLPSKISAPPDSQHCTEAP